MKIADVLERSDRTLFSLEVFPPKTKAKEGMKLQQRLSTIFDTVDVLQKYEPAFVSVTYNAEHLTRATSIPIAAIIKERFKVETMAHLTCINTPVEELDRTLHVLGYFNIDNILALRGDLPPGNQTLSGGLPHSIDLVREIRSRDAKISIGVASYPEGHPESMDREGLRDLVSDFDHLVDKIDQGADFTISQLFFEDRLFFGLVDRLRRRGIEIPIIPGIMPMVNAINIGVVKKLTGASIPEGLCRMIEENRNDPDEVFEIGVEHAIGQCKGLMDKVPCIHFYTMDSWKATDRIIMELI